MGTFSWKRGLKHAGLAALLFLVISLALTATAVGRVTDPEKLGEGMGQAAVFVLAIALGVSYLAQTGRRRAARGIAFTLIAGYVFVMAYNLFAPSNHAKAEPLSAAERAPLVAVDEGGQRRLRHPLLGFSILHPGPGFTESEAAAAIMSKSSDDPATHFYAYTEDPPQSVLMVGVVKDAGATRGGFEDMIDGIQRGLTESTRAQLGAGAKVRYERREVIWEGDRHEAHIHAVVADLAHIQMSAYGFRPPGGHNFVVLVTVASSDPAALAGVLDSFRP